MSAVLNFDLDGEKNNSEETKKTQNRRENRYSKQRRNCNRKYLGLHVYLLHQLSFNNVLLKYKKRDFYLDVLTILNPIKLTIWTISAFRVIYPRQ